MIIGVIRESQPGETRVSATPSTAAQLIKLGYEMVVEPGAGAGSKFADQAYVAAGAIIGDALKADVVLGVNAPSTEQLDAMRDGATLVSILSPDLHPGLAGDLSRRRLTALAMDAVPRISRAQSLDVLSSMANIAGFRVHRHRGEATTGQVPGQARMQVRTQDAHQCGTVPHGIQLLSRRRVDPEHHVGLHRVADASPGRDVRLVGELRPRSGTRLDHHLVSQLDQLRRGAGRRGHASLARLRFPYHSDDQCCPPEAVSDSHGPGYML